jgi:anthranilate/para-aminobenzoate synthase component II
MKILLIDNHTQHMHALTQSLSGHEIEIQKYQPGIAFHDAGKDLVILSGGGGEGLEIEDKVNRHKLWYQDQMSFVRGTNKPVLGICMGFEVIIRAYGGKVLHRSKIIQGFKNSIITDKGQKQMGLKVINQLESHFWYVPEVSDKEFDVLAISDSGIEMVQHKNRKLLGTQFHPEEGGTMELDKLIKTFA